MMSVVEMSVCGGVLILAVLAVRLAAVNRLPKTALRLLWAVALCRLLLPLRVPSPTSFYTAVERLGAAAGVSGLLLDGGRTVENAPGNTFPVLPAVWAAGAVLLGAYFLVCHLRSRRGYRESLPLEHPVVRDWMEGHRLRRPVQVRVSDQTGSPLTYGVLWPVILLPKSLDWDDPQEIAFVLAHEHAHIRRFDALVKWLLAAALCVHWFNPLVWVMYLLANRDLELSCDEAVVREYGRQSRESYALTLVGMAERGTAFAPLESGFSKSALKERITSIMRSHRATVAGTSAALALVAIVAVVFATSSPGHGTRAAVQNVLEGPIAPGTDTNVVENVARSQENTWTDDWSSYTQQQYDQLKEALYTEGYEEMPIADFNRKINTALNPENNEELMMVYELVQGALPDNDPMAAFLRNTVNASLREYYARLEEAYSGGRKDPEFSGTAETVQNQTVLGKNIGKKLWANYSFTYRILDQDGLTVGERDAFLQSVMEAARESLARQAEQGGGKEDFLRDLETSAGEASNDKIEFTGGRVEDVELSGILDIGEEAQ